MAQIEVLRKDIAADKLTIAKDRVTLKIREALSPETEQWMLTFAERIVGVVNQTLKPIERTMRGRFKRHRYNPCIQISLAVSKEGGGVKVLRTLSSHALGMSTPPEEL